MDIRVVERWSDDAIVIKLPGVPRLGDVVVVSDDLDGTVKEVVWEDGGLVSVRIG